MFFFFYTDHVCDSFQAQKSYNESIKERDDKIAFRRNTHSRLLDKQNALNEKEGTIQNQDEQLKNQDEQLKTQQEKLEEQEQQLNALAAKLRNRKPHQKPEVCTGYQDSAA